MANKCNEEYFRKRLVPIIASEIVCMQAIDGVLCADVDVACDDIWREYKEFNTLSSVLYIKSSDELLDRHKVASCYLYACLKARPLSVQSSIPKNDIRWLANEAFALSIACAVLHGYLSRILDGLQHEMCSYEGLTQSQLDKARASVEEGVQFERFFTGYDTYADSVLNYLFFTASEGTYNVLANALIMYHWEQSLFSSDMQAYIASFIRQRKKERSV